jgi:gluconate 5-dehydrogenase
MSTVLGNDTDFNSIVIDTTPAGRWGAPRRSAAAAVFLASDEASYVNVQTLLVDGGMTTAL